MDCAICVGVREHDEDGMDVVGGVELHAQITDVAADGVGRYYQALGSGGVGESLGD